MNMKKILALCIVALMMLEAGGCGAGSAALAAADESVLAQSPESAAADESIPSEGETAGEDDVKLSDDASDFVLLSEAVPDAILEIRYYSTYNFIGDRIDGYEEPLAFLTKEAAAALKEVSDDVVAKGYRLKIYDAYRPQRAVTNFVNWAKELDDTRMKEYFYPELDKDVLFPQGYIAEHSGHSRGSTVDLTLFDMRTEKEVDMGGTFDYFGELSHPDYRDITDEQYENRMILREAMVSHGFKPLVEEWWHFTLENEPYPDTYFTFPINSDSLEETSQKAAGADGNEFGTLSRDGFDLQQVVILSRHNIRSPLSAKGSVLDTLTPYTWFNWSSSPSSLSLRGGTLETEMGQYFRKWLEKEELFPEDYRPEADEVSLGAADYELSATVERKTPIGGKLVFGRWADAEGKEYISVDMVYQTTEQLQNVSLLDLESPPMSETVVLDGLEANEQGLYAAQEVEARIRQAIDEYDEICGEYAMDAVA